MGVEDAESIFRVESRSRGERERHEEAKICTNPGNQGEEGRPAVVHLNGVLTKPEYARFSYVDHSTATCR